MVARRFLWIFLLLALASSVFGQVDTTENRVNKDLEVAFEEFEEDADADTEQLAQLLQDLARNPININRASVNELLQIPGMNLRFAAAIIKYRVEEKPFESVKDLSKVPGIGKVTAYRFEPYITVGGGLFIGRDILLSPKYWLDGIGFETISRYQSILEDQAGYVIDDPETNAYVGSQFKYYQRFTLASKHISLNLTQEKDPGETLGYPNEFDFNSWHVAVQDVGVIRQVVVGDYSASFGLGLVMFNGGAFGKSRDVIGGAARSDRGIRPYRSAEENRFFKGAGFVIGEKIQLSGMVSDRQWSANLVGQDSANFPSLTGFSRTNNELANRNNLNIKTMAGRLRYTGNQFVIGATGYTAEFDKYIVQRSGLSNLYRFQGQTSSVIGADGKFFWEDIQVYGEVARSQNEAFAGILGVDFDFNRETEVSVVARNFARDYQTIYGAVFSESSGFPQNERGIYLGLRQKITDKIRLSGYVDQFNFDEPRFGVDQASSGIDFLGNLDIIFNSGTSLYILGRSESKEVSFTTVDQFGRNISDLDKEVRSSMRINFEHDISKKLRWRSRLELSRYNSPNVETEYGMLIFQDFRVSPSRWIQLDMRITYFDTDSFNARVFQFENDLLFAMTNTALAGRGMRYYILAKISPIKRLDIWAKYDATVYDDREIIGSGLDQIEGNVRSRFGIQARYSF